ncbi:MAG: flagellar basal body rod protein FlgC, partial [Alphaproteobacteria bacterium]
METLFKSLMISAAGMRAQGTRLRVISENIANAQSTGDSAGAAPYRRKTISFEN